MLTNFTNFKLNHNNNFKINQTLNQLFLLSSKTSRFLKIKKYSQKVSWYIIRTLKCMLPVVNPYTLSVPTLPQLSLALPFHQTRPTIALSFPYPFEIMRIILQKLWASRVLYRSSLSPHICIWATTAHFSAALTGKNKLFN